MVIADESLSSLRVSGTFRFGQQDTLLQALGTALDIEVRRTTVAIELRANLDHRDH